jgi:hypothetical protein
MSEAAYNNIHSFFIHVLCDVYDVRNEASRRNATVPEKKTLTPTVLSTIGQISKHRKNFKFGRCYMLHAT